MEQPLEQSLELVWNWFDFAFARYGAIDGAQKSRYGTGLTLHLPVMERLLELIWAGLELV
jgi:hypothetical protein